MDVIYVPARLSAGVEAALGRLKSAAERDGYRMQANLLLVSKCGREASVVYRDGGWYELEEAGGGE